uniref:Uncharacterized protein LOC111125002 isoform X2 n=1 Tax=Crassostrea virginica TaxID=6565 RepID=A0A8B8D981_CRAVI|nr:uncharacterized protein LOC111125002 isoform X2 [Crassostrea virginica]
MMFKVILQVAVVAIVVGARSEVKAGTDSIFMVRSPMAKCSAISCDVSVVVWSEHEVNDQWVIFKNGTAMRITDWQDQSNKYSASKSKTSDGCVTWCNFTITLRIQNPDPSLDYGTYQLILQSYDSQSIPYDKLALNFTVPTHRTDDEGTGALSDTRELPLTTIIVIAASGTCMTVFICFTVCLVVFCRGKGTKKKKQDERKRRPQSSLGVSTHLYDEVDSVAHNAYCELNEDARKISAHQYIQPIPEETPIYKAPEIFSNTESPTAGRAQPRENIKDAMGYLQPSVKFRPEMTMSNQLYEESNKPRDKKPLEPTYSNAQKLPLLPKKDSILDREINVEIVYAQPHPPHKATSKKTSFKDVNSLSSQEPTYGNEQRTPPLPMKVSHQKLLLERTLSMKEPGHSKSITPKVPSIPVGRVIPNQLYAECQEVSAQKRPAMPTYSNPIVTNHLQVTKNIQDHGRTIRSCPACIHIHEDEHSQLVIKKCCIIRCTLTI